MQDSCFLKMGIWYGNLLISVLNGAGILLLTMREYWGIWVHQIINIRSPIEDAAIDVYYLWTPNINIHFPTENAAIDVYYSWTHLWFLVWYIEYILVCNYGLGNSESTQVTMYSQGAWVLKLFTVTIQAIWKLSRGLLNFSRIEPCISRILESNPFHYVATMNSKYNGHILVEFLIVKMLKCSLRLLDPIIRIFLKKLNVSAKYAYF